MTLWRHFTWPAWRDQPGRVVLAVIAVALGVALAFGVHLLNGAALAEFARAARGVNGRPDLVLRARPGPLTDADVAEVRSGLQPGDVVILHTGDRVREGTAVTPAAAE